MNKIDSIKDKIAKKGKKDLGVYTAEFIQAVEREVAIRIADSEQAKVVQKIGEIVTEMKGMLEANENGFQNVIDYLEGKEREEKATNAVSDKFYAKVVN